MQGSGFTVHGSRSWWRLRRKYIWAMPEGSWVAVFPYRHLERSREIFLADREMVYVRESVAQLQQDVISLSPHTC